MEGLTDKLMRLTRASHKAALKLAIEGDDQAKHYYAMKRAMKPYEIEFMIKGNTIINREHAVRRGMWVYKRLKRLEAQWRKTMKMS